MSHISERENLREVKKEIKELESRRDLLLDKENKSPSEIKFLEEYDEKLKELKQDKKYWQGIIEKGILLLR